MFQSFKVYKRPFFLLIILNYLVAFSMMASASSILFVTSFKGKVAVSTFGSWKDENCTDGLLIIKMILTIADGPSQFAAR